MARIYDPGSDIPTYDPVDSDPPISDPADTTPTASQPVTSDTLYGSGGSSIQGTDGADKLGGGRYNDTLQLRLVQSHHQCDADRDVHRESAVAHHQRLRDHVISRQRAALGAALFHWG